MTLSIGEVSIGADAQGRAALCEKLRKLREEGFPVVPAAKDGALAVVCGVRPAETHFLELADVRDAKRAVCEYAASPAALAYDGIDWLTLRRGDVATTGDQLRARLEPLSVHTYAALLFAFGYERIDGRDAAGKTLVSAPLHQIDGFCAN